ncbi:sulfatase-like hydrolase/transferase [Verrucomicrobiales bacterium BCK34]|nr:sulfatase-like hydrolase/transferase [Verrucomicrobiales bacterium BCK34]
MKTLSPALPALVLLFTSLLQSNASERPNILLILADDLGFSDLGCYGSEIHTPNLDSLAESGLQFTQFYNTARCWPTRGSLLTGFYAQQIRRDNVPGVPSGGGNRGVRQDWAVLLPELLAPVGYRSYHTGKWHIDGMPVENGFDHSYYLKDQGRFFNPTKHFKDDEPLPPVKKGTDFYATTHLADHVIEVLTDHELNHKSSPFFHYLAFAAPHFPLHALPEDIAFYDDAYKAGWDAVRERRWRNLKSLGLLDSQSVPELSRIERDLGPPYHFPGAFEILGDGEINKPIPWADLTDKQKAFQEKKMAIHAAMIHRMDIEIGRVFDRIKSMGEWDNTMIIFLSDNGASAEIMVRDDGHDSSLPMGAADTYLCLGPGWSTTANTPFRRHKTWTHEGGIATPLLVSWPDGIADKGGVRRTPGHVIDIVPTLLEVAGAKPDPNAPAAPGKSLTGTFNADAESLHEAIWWFHDGHKAIRMGDWKAVAPIAEPWELYDLSTDRDESTDLAVPQAAILNKLVKEWERRMVEYAATAAEGLPEKALKNAGANPAQSDQMNAAQDAGRPKRTQVLINGENIRLKDRHAFIMTPETPPGSEAGKPWIFYGPTLKGTPDKAESWMHQQFLDAGVAIAGIDVGEAYGSPHAFPYFEALHNEMVSRGYSEKPALLGRSRGGLWVSSWAIEHPDRVAGLGGIYPVYDYTTYPKVGRAAAAYATTAKNLEANQSEFNPIKKATALAEAKIPVFIIHGTDDKVVPLAENSGALESIYENAGKGDLITVLKMEGQGHSFWPGFFHCQELVDFLIASARGE